MMLSVKVPHRPFIWGHTNWYFIGFSDLCANFHTHTQTELTCVTPILTTFEYKFIFVKFIPYLRWRVYSIIPNMIPPLRSYLFFQKRKFHDVKIALTTALCIFATSHWICLERLLLQIMTPYTSHCSAYQQYFRHGNWWFTEQ